MSEHIKIASTVSKEKSLLVIILACGVNWTILPILPQSAYYGKGSFHAVQLIIVSLCPQK